MPEKIRAAVTSKEITPESSRSKLSEDRQRHPSNRTHPWTNQNKSENSSVSVEQLDEEPLKGLTSEYDLKIFKEAWMKAVQANEEVISSSNPWRKENPFYLALMLSAGHRRVS